MPTDIETSIQDSEILNYCRGDMVFGSNQADNMLYAKYEVKCKPDKADCDLNTVKE